MIDQLSWGYMCGGGGDTGGEFVGSNLTKKLKRDTITKI